MSSTISAKLVARNMAKFRQELKSVDADRKKAANTAVKVEAYRLRWVLKGEIKAGAPGGKQFSPLRVVTRGARNRRPLRRLHLGVFYWVSTGKTNKFSVGFGGKGLKVRSSSSWMKIAKRTQEGTSSSVDEQFSHSTPRQYLRRQGKKHLEAGRKRIAKYFFLRKSTTHIKTPARPIIDPFWQAHQQEAWKNIKSNFIRKLAGERI